MEPPANPSGCCQIPTECCDLPGGMVVTIESPGMPEWDGVSFSLVPSPDGTLFGSKIVDCIWDPTCLYMGSSSGASFNVYCLDPTLGLEVDGGIGSVDTYPGPDCGSTVPLDLAGSAPFVQACPTCETTPTLPWYVWIAPIPDE